MTRAISNGCSFLLYNSMKILERKEQPTAIVNCSHCGSKLEIERSDIWWKFIWNLRPKFRIKIETYK